MRTLKIHGHEVVYWLGYDGGEVDTPAGAIFHSHSDASRALPARGVDASEFSPPGEDLIAKLHKTESILLTMMNRAFDRLSVDERRRVYYRMLRYWTGMLRAHRPDVIIFPALPHAADDYLLYELAHLFRVRTIFLYDTWVSDRLLHFEDFRKGSPALSKELAKSVGKNFSVDDLSPDLREYYQENRKKYYRPSGVYYLDEQMKKYSLWRHLQSEPKVRQSIRNGSVVWKAPRFLFYAFRRHGFLMINYAMSACARVARDTLKKEYARVERMPDFSRKFIYVPLHSQPERATSPQGDIFADQILMMELLAAGLPSGWEIYVKEHPIQWLRWGTDFSSARYRGYYGALAKIRNVRIVPIKTSFRELIAKSQAVATVTGMTGWEALFCGKPVLVFGYPWYRDCRGVVRVSDTETCRAALTSVANGALRVSEQDVINYLKALDDATIHGYVEKLVSRISPLSKQESMNNITRLLLAELDHDLAKQ